MVEVILHVVAAVAIFGIGVAVGVEKPPVLSRAIRAIQDAEGNAKDILATITAHKAS
jgi:hypothetical protein